MIAALGGGYNAILGGIGKTGFQSIYLTVILYQRIPVLV